MYPSNTFPLPKELIRGVHHFEGGSHSRKPLCRHSAEDRGTAAAASCIDSVMRSVSSIPSKTRGKMRHNEAKFGKFSVRLDLGTSLHSSPTCPRRSGLANNHEQVQICLQSAAIWRMSAKRLADILEIKKAYEQKAFTLFNGY